MDSLEEPDTHSFIVKVWVEDRAEDADRGIWRGYITKCRVTSTAI